MKRLLSGAIGLASLAFPSAAHAYPGYYYHPQPYYYNPPSQVSFGFTTNNVAFWVHQPFAVRPPRVRRRPIRIDENCVYKPWKDEVICRY